MARLRRRIRGGEIRHAGLQLDHAGQSLEKGQHLAQARLGQMTRGPTWKHRDEEVQNRLEARLGPDSLQSRVLQNPLADAKVLLPSLHSLFDFASSMYLRLVLRAGVERSCSVSWPVHWADHEIRQEHLDLLRASFLRLRSRALGPYDCMYQEVPGRAIELAQVEASDCEEELWETYVSPVVLREIGAHHMDRYCDGQSHEGKNAANLNVPSSCLTLRSTAAPLEVVMVIGVAMNLPCKVLVGRRDEAEIENEAGSLDHSGWNCRGPGCIQGQHFQSSQRMRLSQRKCEVSPSRPCIASRR